MQPGRGHDCGINLHLGELGCGDEPFCIAVTCARIVNDVAGEAVAGAAAGIGVIEATAHGAGWTTGDDVITIFVRNFVDSADLVCKFKVSGTDDTVTVPAKFISTSLLNYTTPPHNPGLVAVLE